MSSKLKEVDYANFSLHHLELLKKTPLHYKKLVVPLRMRSVYWKYFGFPADEDGRILTKDKIVCILCKTQMIYNRNTSNLRMHLISKHKSVIQKLDASNNASVTPRTRKSSTKNNLISKNIDDNLDMTSVGVMGISPKKGDTKDMHVVVSEEVNETDISNIAIIFPNNDELDVSEYSELKEPEENEYQIDPDISEAVVNFIITDLVPPSIIEGKGFSTLLSNLSGKTILLPSERKFVNEIIPNFHNTCKEQLFSSVTSNCITNISLSIEEWTSADNYQCLSIYMHYLQNGEPSLFTKLLTTVCCTGLETVIYWESVLNKLFSEWSINPNAITAVLVSFSNEELKTALKSCGFVLLPCFLFMIQELCVQHCFKQPKISYLLIKCRSIVKFIQEMKIDVEEDSNMDVEDDDNYDHSMSLDCSEVWLTTYYMLQSLIRRKNTLSEFFNNLSTAPAEININSGEWASISDLLTLLEPLKTIVITLLEVKNPLISLLKPLIWQVNSSKFEIIANDSSVIQQLKTIIRNVLNDAYSEDSAADNLTQMATTLDPRFKSFIQQEDTCSNQNNLTELLTHLVQSEGSLSPNDFQAEKSTKKTNRSSINALFGSFYVVKPSLSLEEKVKIEISHYKNENNALLEECPLEWWQHMRNKCPNLSRLALKYHCVPAIVMWNSGSRNFDDYTSFYRRRGLLKANVVDSILFLNSNKCTL